MSPLKVEANCQTYQIPAEGGMIKTFDEISIVYGGDGSPQIVATLPDKSVVGIFTFSQSGTSTQINYCLLVKDIDGKFGPVLRTVGLERI